MVKENTMKQTEIGLLPEDWDVVNLNEISKISSSKRIFESDYVAYGIPFYRGKEISLLMQNKTIDEPFYISEAKYFSLANKYGYPKNGDLLITAVGTLGNIYCINNDEKFYFKDGNLIWINNIIQNSKFLKIALDYNKQQILDNAIGSSQKALTINSLSITKIPLPSLPEQEAIAEALSDADAWIESLEQLIAKKRLIKQGAMQELLSPKDVWEVRKLGEVGKIYGGLSGKTKQDFGSGNSYYIPFMNVMKNVVTDKNFIEKVNLKQGETQNRVLKNDLLFNGSSETPEELGISSVLLDDIDNLYLNSFCFGFRIFDENVSPIFLSYIMRSPYGREVIFYLAQGATRYNLSKANFFNLEIAFPKSLSEQTHIATILSDMDAELEALEGQLGKARKVKQGMMQELLTGRVRLV